MLQLLFFILRLCVAFANLDIVQNLFAMRSKTQDKLDLSQTFFSSLENYHVNAKTALEKSYPWIARVVHSRTRDIPYMCTAACIYDRIFVTAARCITSLKVIHTTVIYQSKKLPVRAFVLPSNPTSQLFDDIGFLVVEPSKDKIVFDVAKLFYEKKRTDETFKWFRAMNLSRNWKVVGYVTEKRIYKIRIPERVFTLKELPVEVGVDICSTIVTRNRIQGFHVPCYHSCTVKEYKAQAKKCNNYHGVEGGAVIDAKTNKLFGLATWGPYFAKHELPVGFSVLNSKAYYEDYECAKKIRVADLKTKNAKTYQEFCN